MLELREEFPSLQSPLPFLSFTCLLKFAHDLLRFFFLLLFDLGLWDFWGRAVRG
jgi:hypothetical protein